MTAPKFIISQGEHGDEIFEGETKLAFTNATGSLQFTRGNAERREEVEAWIKRHEAHAKDDAPGQPQPVTECEAEVIEETVRDKTVEKALERPVDPRINPIICPIAGSPQFGDKDPAVVAWWFKNHPEQAKNKYAGRRFKSESGIIV